MLTCPQCANQVPDGYRFCWNCGSSLESKPDNQPVQQATAPALSEPISVPPVTIQAQLTLVKGEGFPGISYKLRAREHQMGRLYGTILFPDDQYLSHQHANLYYDHDKLFLTDEGSINGVFIKIRDTVPLQHGDHFLVGEQLIRFEKVDSYEPYPGATPKPNDDAKFYGCPAEKQLCFRLVHLFRNHEEGAILYASSPNVRLGREHCDLSFPFDRHISGRHARVYEENGAFFLQDLSSRNGTFLRLSQPYQLQDGDYFFAGQQLFRVEIAPLV